VSQERKDALLKLLQVEPDHLSGLVHATGWGEEQTRMALLQLTVDGLVSWHNRSGRRYYSTVHRIHTQTVSHA
jgi:DNA-binding IclR family transcriptional regulator